MTIPLFDRPTNTRQLIFQDTLNKLFTCGFCGRNLIEQVPLAIVEQGKVEHLMCPGCNRVWSFCRHPVVTERDPALEHAVEDAARHARSARVRIY